MYKILWGIQCQPWNCATLAILKMGLMHNFTFGTTNHIGATFTLTLTHHKQSQAHHNVVTLCDCNESFICNGVFYWIEMFVQTIELNEKCDSHQNVNDFSNIQRVTAKLNQTFENYSRSLHFINHFNSLYLYIYRWISKNSASEIVYMFCWCCYYQWVLEYILL